MARHGFGKGDRKSTRLNSSHVEISYAVFCLKKKKKATQTTRRRATLSLQLPRTVRLHRHVTTAETGPHAPPRAREPGKVSLFFFFFNDPAPPEIYPLSLPAALPI